MVNRSIATVHHGVLAASPVTGARTIVHYPRYRFRCGRSKLSTHGRPSYDRGYRRISSAARCRRCTGTRWSPERPRAGRQRSKTRNRLRGIASEWNRWRHVGSPITIILATRYIVLPAWYSTSLVIRSLRRRIVDRASMVSWNPTRGGRRS